MNHARHHLRFSSSDNNQRLVDLCLRFISSFYPLSALSKLSNRHLLVAISSHGFGHLAQVAPVINALGDTDRPNSAPAFDLTVRSALSAKQIETRVCRHFEIDAGTDDFGMIMRDALHVDLPASLLRYEQTHRSWNALVDRVAGHLAALNVDAVLADAPYLTLAAAKAANIPSAAICSLNWADILEQCVMRDNRALKMTNISSAALDLILQQIRDAYAAANVVLRPAPAIETTGFDFTDIAPIVENPHLTNRDALLALVSEQTGISVESEPSPWLVLASMGGIGLPIDTAHWPTQWAGRPIVYLLDKTLLSGKPHTVALNVDRLSFQATLAACDLVLTKPGYGMFVEAAAHGKPLLFLSRHEWPESACLTRWVAEHLPCRQITLDRAARGEFASELGDLLSSGSVSPQLFQGKHEAAGHLGRWLQQSWHSPSVSDAST